MKSISRKRVLKRRRMLWLAVIILELCILFGEVGYFIWDITKDKTGEDTALISANKDGVDLSDKSKLPNDKGANASNNEYDKYIFVGDSRCVGMEAYVETQDEDIFICKNNMGYSYLKNQLSNIKAIATPDSVVIICLGVNDLDSGCTSYIKTINEMYNTMECDICYLLVNPVDEVNEGYSGYTIKNSEIDSFNNKIKQGLNSNIKIIDCNSYLKRDGFNSPDGLHYSADTYEKIYKYIKENV